MRTTHAAGVACRVLPWAAPRGWLTHGQRGGGAPCRPAAAQALQGAYVPLAQAGRRLPPPGRRARAGVHHPREERGMACTTNKLPRLAEGPAPLRRGGGGAGRWAEAAAGGGGRQRAHDPNASAVAAAAPSEAIAGVLSPFSVLPATGPSDARGGAGHSGRPRPPRPPRAHEGRGFISDQAPQTTPLCFRPLQCCKPAAADSRAACNMPKAPPPRNAPPRRVPHARLRRPPPRGASRPPRSSRL
jgi:hypothetical protein